MPLQNKVYNYPRADLEKDNFSTQPRLEQN